MRVLLLFLVVSPIGAAPADVIGFDRALPGKLLVGWSVVTHAGAPPHWEIVRDKSASSPANVLAELSRNRTAGIFPLAIWASLQDGERLFDAEDTAFPKPGQGFSNLGLRDHELLNREFILYDALYAECKERCTQDARK